MIYDWRRRSTSYCEAGNLLAAQLRKGNREGEDPGPGKAHGRLATSLIRCFPGKVGRGGHRSQSRREPKHLSQVPEVQTSSEGAPGKSREKESGRKWERGASPGLKQRPPGPVPLCPAYVRLEVCGHLELGFRDFRPAEPPVILSLGVSLS